LTVASFGFPVASASPQRPDTAGDVGLASSLELDAVGNPVISYLDVANGDLKLAHCDDPDCVGLDDESIQSLDTVGIVGLDSSLALDAAGNPVISYRDSTNGDLKLVHCNDPNCVGNDESIQRPDSAGNVGRHGSLKLDSAGNPVISYFDSTNFDLKLLHCNDPNCAGDDDSIQSPDMAGDVGRYASLALDAAGNPVISYYDLTNGDLKLVHCNDSNCAGNDETIKSPDTGGNVGGYSTLALDEAGKPVISYFDAANGPKLLHCNDPDCAGGDESIHYLDTSGDVGWENSLALDSAGNPVISYYDSFTHGDLKLAHCNDPNCTGGDESILSPDTAGDTGLLSSLALDAAGNPVISYYDRTDSDLRLLHCKDPNCAAGEHLEAPDKFGTVGLHTSVRLDAAGNPVISYYASVIGDLKVLHCDDPNCTEPETRTTVDVDDDVGRYTSLRLDSAGNPVTSYYDSTNFDLKLLHCNDPNCAGDDESIQSPDMAGDVGRFTSLALDAAGNPVISYYDDSNGDLKLVHCNDLNCFGGDESISSVDTLGEVGLFTSLALDAAGRPVISYWDATFGDLKVAHCNDPNCAGSDESLQSPDASGNTGTETSLVLDTVGNPVISYQDQGNGDLKLAHCNDPNCAFGDESIRSIDTDGNVGFFTSLALDPVGDPVISYNAVSDISGAFIGDLRVAHCNDPDCVGGDESIQSPDTAGNVGRYSSLALDAAGNPVVSYIDSTYVDLKLMHCNDPKCADALPNVSDDDPPNDAPVVNGTPGNDDWYRSAVTVAWNWIDSGSGIDPSNCVQTSRSIGEGSAIIITSTCQDLDGNATSDSMTFKVDTTAPTVTVTGITDGGQYVYGSAPAAGCSTADDTSGVAVDASVIVTTSGSNGAGPFTAICSGAADNAGNQASSVSVSYIVVYAFNGFFSPIDNPPVLNSIKGGQGIPVKFGLGSNLGLNVLAVGYPNAQQITCNTSAPLDVVEETVTAGSSSLSYDASTGRYVYVWKTNKAWAGTCRKLVVRLADGTDHTAIYRFT
jgi:hypothetical protein